MVILFEQQQPQNPATPKTSRMYQANKHKKIPRRARTTPLKCHHRNGVNGGGRSVGRSCLGVRACHFYSARPQLNCELCYEIYKGECDFFFFMNSVLTRAVRVRVWRNVQVRVVRVRIALLIRTLGARCTTVLHSRCMNIYEEKYVCACAF